MKAFQELLNEKTITLASSGIHLNRLRFYAYALLSEGFNLQFCATPVELRGSPANTQAAPPGWLRARLDRLKLSIYCTAICLTVFSFL
jgi:hypothetical protein